MPKKACCCGGNWIAVPCRYYGGMGFVGYHYTGATGFTGSDTSAQLNNFVSGLSGHPVYGASGYYKDGHPYYQLPYSSFVFVGYGNPPMKLKGITCDNQPTGGIFGGYNGGYGSGSECENDKQKCFELELDTQRQIVYKAWGAGGGGVNNVTPGGNGAYAQKTGTYNKDYIAVVGYGGIGSDPGRSFTGWTAAVDTVPAGGGQGYGAWGGGAAYLATSIEDPESAFLIAGGGGGAGRYSANGGQAGVTLGGMGGGDAGGSGGTQTSGGKGGTGAQDGQGSKGGRGAFDILNIIGGGGGGGGGLRGGGGGGFSGSGGGGGSSTVTDKSRPANTSGTAHMCDPDYWVVDVAGLAGYQNVAGSGGWIPTNINSDGTGLSGKINLNFASLRCPCNQSLSSIPEQTYYCLTNAQADYICSLTQDCCTGNTQGITGATGASGGTGSTGSTGYNPCNSLANFNTVIERRGSTAGTTGGTASIRDIGLGGGYGGGGLGAFTCPDSTFGLSGGSGATGFQELSRTGELSEVLYKTFKYNGELYYLLFQCGAPCDPDYMLPEDAEITEVACKPWANCCEGIYAFPICEIPNNNTPQSCWGFEYCPCNKTTCPNSFYSCDDVDSYPEIFYTRKNGWYYLAFKTSLWEPFGDSIQERGTINDVILENPCTECSAPNQDCNNTGNSGGLGSNNSGDTEPKNCCTEVSEPWNGKSPFNANVNFSINYTGQGTFLSDCTLITNDCSCSYDFRETPFIDSSSFTAKLSLSNSYYYSEEQTVGGNCRTPQCPPLPGSDVPNSSKPRLCVYTLSPFSIFFNNGEPQTGPYNLPNVGSAIWGSGLGQQCYGRQTECGIKNDVGLPDLESDLNQPNVLRDAAYKIITECVIVDPECTAGTGSPYPFNIYAEGTCDGIPPGPLDLGPLVKANGCRLSTYIAALQAASEGKYTVIDLGAPDTYWIGGPRDIIQGIPGDRVDIGDAIVTDIPSGDKLIRRIEYTVYVNSPVYSIYVYVESKRLTNCCDSDIRMTWGHSLCGRKTPQYAACIPNPTNCPDFDNSYVVSTFKTLQQWEADPQTQMINPKCWSGVDGFSCPEIWDDFDNPQICNVTLI
jgi:hypothetical protein